jgi:hypothetical protein
MGRRACVFDSAVGGSLARLIIRTSVVIHGWNWPASLIRDIARHSTVT